jgi:hypothetical protein
VRNRQYLRQAGALRPGTIEQSDTQGRGQESPLQQNTGVGPC